MFPNMLLRIRSLAPWLASCFCVLLTSIAAQSQGEVIDSELLQDPVIPTAKVVRIFPERLRTLWLQCLSRPEEELKTQAAAAIALAHERGMAGLGACTEPLIQLLDRPGEALLVRLAAAQALITLDARRTAPSLLKHAETDGIDMRDLVEPVLARWTYKPIQDVWVKRLSKGGTPDRSLLLAIQGLGIVGQKAGNSRLRELTLSQEMPPIVRLEAARTLGTLVHSGLEQDADRIAKETPLTGSASQVVAASLLRRHHGPESAKILLRLAVGTDAAAACVALAGLLENDSRSILPILPRVIASPDANVRILGVQTFRKHPSAEHIVAVSELLDDPHPEVRAQTCAALVEVAKRSEYHDTVQNQGKRFLATQLWRALEQSVILLTLLDYKPAAPRFIELLQFQRPEVFLAAAWGLRRLKLPETLPAQVREVEKRWRESEKKPADYPTFFIDQEMAQLAQSLGRARYAAAAPALARLVPKGLRMGPDARVAAIWALGLIHEKAPPEVLVDALIGRVTDESVIFAEDMGVRSMSAISLGRMKADRAEESLQKYYAGKLSTERFPNACGWALEQFGGQKLPRTGTAEVVQKGWFLEPIQ